jgi:hypothetical protein
MKVLLRSPRLLLPHLLFERAFFSHLFADVSIFSLAISVDNAAGSLPSQHNLWPRGIPIDCRVSHAPSPPEARRQCCRRLSNCVTVKDQNGQVGPLQRARVLRAENAVGIDTIDNSPRSRKRKNFYFDARARVSWNETGFIAT